MNGPIVSTGSLARLYNASAASAPWNSPQAAGTGLHVSHFPAHSVMSPHRHQEDSMSIVVSGSMREQIKDGERLYDRGHATFLPAGLTHSQKFGPAGTRQIIFIPRADWLEYLKDCKSRLDQAPHVRSAAFRELGDRLCREMRDPDNFSALACEGLLLEIVAQFGRCGTAATAPKKPPAWLCAARDFMRENACFAPSMAQIAREASRHEIHLAREFRRFFGVPVGVYLRQLRVERARDLLLNRQSSISEVALTCGFSNHSHFCREFRAQTGITPSQYRSSPSRYLPVGSLNEGESCAGSTRKSSSAGLPAPSAR
jgi:AraC family transcriptional regulator